MRQLLVFDAACRYNYYVLSTHLDELLSTQLFIRYAHPRRGKILETVPVESLWVHL